MVQAILPYYRARKSGDIVFISSIYGLTAQPGCVSYAATKFALEGLHEALLMENAQFGIRSFIFEPGVCRTHVCETAKSTLEEKHHNFVEELAPMRNFLHQINRAMGGNEVGDPKKVVKIIVDMVRGEGVAEGREVPHRLPLGSDALIAVQPKPEAMLKEWKEWENVILSTDCDDVKGGEEPEYVKLLQGVKG